MQQRRKRATLAYAAVQHGARIGSGEFAPFACRGNQIDELGRAAEICARTSPAPAAIMGRTPLPNP
eukprot:4894888-Pyramimonas_sp.AAC.1